MELNGFMIGPEIKKLFKIKVVTPTARHPVVLKIPVESISGSAWLYSAKARVKTCSTKKFLHFLTYIIVFADQMSGQNE